MTLLCSLAALVLLSAATAFNVSNLVSSNAVLQRGKTNVIFGFSNTSETISAKWIDGVTYSSAPVDAAGIWRVAFPPTAASLDPFSLVFSSSLGGPTTTLANLLIGDVFLCAGQSNMGAVQVSAMWNVSDMLAQAVQYQPFMRILQVSGNLQSPVPFTEWSTSGFVPWQAPLGTDGNTTGPLLGFSAVCYIMGSTLADEHLARQVPVGLIHSSHGGTSIQAWASPEGAVQCGDNSDSWNSSVLYNSNFHPLTVGPTSLAGIYYYQGEQDCGIGATETYWRAAWYSCSLRALIRDWRAQLADASIFWVEQQLHAWLHTNDIGLATFRAGQLKALSEPRTALSTAFDGGDPASAMAGSPGGTVHSHMKFVPGRRAAATFAGAFYNLTVPYLNPRYADAVAYGVSNATSTTLTVTVSMLPGTVTSAGLVQRGWEPLSNSSHCPTERAINASYCDWFAIQVNDDTQSWHNASVALTADKQGVVLTAVVPKGLAAVATRNGFSDWPIVTIYSAEGLPLAPWLKPVNAL